MRDLRPKQTLDVGAAQGFLGQLLKDDNLPIDAIEPNPHWSDHARPFYRTVFPSTVEEAHLPEKTYDCIVCADVLEHLPDPLSVLNQLRRIATDDARFIISVPNIAHLAVRMMLLFGHFPKMDRGPLDRTHLHFFTRKTATQLLTTAGLHIERTSATGIPLDELWKSGQANPFFKLMTHTQRLAVSLLPKLFAFQWIFLARPTRGTPSV